MKSKLKKILIPFILMITIELGYYIFSSSTHLYGNGLNPHMGLIFASGLLLGPYGALGASLGNILCNRLTGYSLYVSLTSGLISFAVSYLCYKLWYSKFYKEEIYPPRLINSGSLVKFLAILLISGLIFSLLKPEAILFFEIHKTAYINLKYFFNYVNFGLIFGIIGIWITRKLDYVCLPKITESYNKSFYKIIFIILLSLTILFSVDEYIFSNSLMSVTHEFPLLTALLCIFLTKPISSKITIPDKTTPERIMDLFNLITIITLIIMFACIILEAIFDSDQIFQNDTVWRIIFSADVYLLIFFLPSTIVLKYIENKLIEPILSFSKIEGFIRKEEKIETEGILDIYSPYIEEDNEIGTLARNYSDLIISNNHYIENINEIESERERMKAELDIAKGIQQSNLPTEAIENESYTVFGYSEPAKEVGGDFYDYYEIDNDNLAIVIGDASGKGVPAALLTTTTQTLIRELLTHEKDPSKILGRVNNHICLNNSETMFITLWLGIYNKNTNVLTFSNAGHNPPIIRKDNRFELLNVDEGVVLGILEDYKFITQEIDFSSEIILYTDGITEAINNNEEMYGEKRLIDFFNNNAYDDNMIDRLIEDISQFTQDAEQFDDMTLLILKK